MTLCCKLLWRLGKLAEVQGVFCWGMEISRGLLNLRVLPGAQGAPAVTSCWTLKDDLGKHCCITASSLKHCPLLATGHYTRYSCLTQNTCFYILVSATRRLGQPHGEPLGSQLSLHGGWRERDSTGTGVLSPKSLALASVPCPEAI